MTGHRTAAGGWKRGAAPFALLLLPPLVLAACQPAPQPIVLRPPAVALRPRAETPPPAPVRPAAAKWSFSVTVAGCEARAAAPGLSLVLRTEADRTLRVALSGASRASNEARLDFAGPDGEISLPVRRAGAVLAAVLPADEASVDRAGVLLGGGTLRLGGGPALLTVPDAGVAGRDWLGCVRSRMEG